MQSVQSHQLTTEELLRIVYVQNFDVPREWVKDLAQRLEHFYDAYHAIADEQTDDLK